MGVRRSFTLANVTRSSAGAASLPRFTFPSNALSISEPDPIPVSNLWLTDSGIIFPPIFCTLSSRLFALY
jgi:hypothetical protein